MLTILSFSYLSVNTEQLRTNVPLREKLDMISLVKREYNVLNVIMHL